MTEASRNRGLQIGDAVRQTYAGRTITILGDTAEVSEEEFWAIDRAAAAYRMTTDAFLAMITKGGDAARAKSQLRRAIVRYLPPGYRWVGAED